jgi:RNA polymerase sigma factor (sigma-70 family)
VEAADSLIAALPAPETDQPEWYTDIVHERRRLRRAMAALKTTERVVLEARFGLPDDADRTLHSVARQLNISAERVRQIQVQALGKLRALLASENH